MEDIQIIEELRGRFDNDPQLKTIRMTLNPFAMNMFPLKGSPEEQFIYVSGKDALLTVDGKPYLIESPPDEWGGTFIKEETWAQHPFGVPDPYAGYLGIDYETCVFR